MSFTWNNHQLHNRLYKGKTRSKGGLNLNDLDRISKFYGLNRDKLQTQSEGQAGGAVDDQITFLSLNAQFHSQMYKKFAKAKPGQRVDMTLKQLASVIKKESADVVCIQEDVVKTETGLTDWLDYAGMEMANQCVSHPVSAGQVGEVISNSIHVKKGLPIAHQYDKGLSQYEKLPHPSDVPEPCAVYSVVNGILVANIHLTEAQYWHKEEGLKQKQIKKILEAGPDIIMGNFSGNIDSTGLDTHPVYSKLSGAAQSKFKAYWTDGHALLVKKGYARVDNNQPTNQDGFCVDHVYYKPDSLELVNHSISKLIKRPGKTKTGDPAVYQYSDHDGLKTTFKILKERDYCDSMVSYSCVIQEDGLSHVTLQKDSRIYRGGDLKTGEARFFSGRSTAIGYAGIGSTSTSDPNALEFQVKKDLRLLDMNNARNIKHILTAAKSAGQDQLDLMTLYFMQLKELNNPKGTFVDYAGRPRPVYNTSCAKRESYSASVCTEGYMKSADYDDDYIARKALKFICSLGYDGWIHMGFMARARANKVSTPFGEQTMPGAVGFHDEIGICRVSDLKKL